MVSIRIVIDHGSDDPPNGQGTGEMVDKTFAWINRMTIYRLLGVNAILIAGLVHLYNAVHHSEGAPLLTFLFGLYFLVTLVASIGISWGGRLWGWALGGFAAVGAIILYLVSRTVGINSLGVESWGPPLAYFSILIEIVFFIPFIAAYSVDLRRLNVGMVHYRNE